MKGDFTRFEFRPEDNFTGVLHQQGRGLLDQDGNAATSIQRHLREQLGRDTIGPDVVAVPAQAGESFRVVKATSDGNVLTVALKPGRGWVDGLPLQMPQIPGETDLELMAEYLGTSVQRPAQKASSIKNGERDALILEVWEESLSAFQDPGLLLEPALGGPDTTARVRLQYALKLLRLAKDAECGNLADSLRDKFENKGRLTVTPSPTQAVGGDCPVQLVGGYTGFEHYLFRIEIAAPDNQGKARFKWSRFNGGLVGRGSYKQAAKVVVITANDQAINSCRCTKFYFEALAYDENYGHWRTVLTADATLPSDGELKLQNPDNFGSVADNDELFFRLWDGIEPVERYASGAKDLQDGIQIKFDQAKTANGNYTPGDYWTFPVRVAGSDFDNPPWPKQAPPEGVRRHRAPLAILNWSNVPSVKIKELADIDDCRRIFQPLTRLESCCSLTVGDGKDSHGDFDSIKTALNQLPQRGGEICVLPGRYEENIVIDRPNVTIRGCGKRSRLLSPAAVAGDTADPVVRVQGRGSVTLGSLIIQADDSGIGVLVENPKKVGVPVGVRLENLVIQAATQSAVKVQDARNIVIRECRISMKDVTGTWPGIFVVADDVLIEHNSVRVIGKQDGGSMAGSGRGGIQLGGTCDRVQVIDNLIQGGVGNGITLGSVEQVNADNETIVGHVSWVIGNTDPCHPCGPGSVYILPPGEGNGTGLSYRSAGMLSDIHIERNRILDMGLNGIGVVAFFETEKQPDIISVDSLDIIGNSIRGCLWRKLEETPMNMYTRMGYGGVSLGDVEALTLRDNQIEDNGPNAAEPVCGVYVLQVEGADIDRNRICNNGARTEQSPNDAKPGARAGIWITQALAPSVSLNEKADSPMVQQGIPAVRIHDNLVSQPAGPALALIATGPVSVQGNNLTTRGIVPGLSNAGFVASTVMIVNLGMTTLIANGAGSVKFLRPGNRSSVLPMDQSVAMRGNRIEIPRHVEGRNRAKQEAARATFMRGDMRFCNNIVESDGVEPEGSFSLSSVLLISLDDIACNDNQCTCMYIPGLDFALANVTVVGMSVRMNDNRFKEVSTEKGLVVLCSGLSIGMLMNHTTDNQANHCLLAYALPCWSQCQHQSDVYPFMVYERNLVLLDLLDCELCGIAELLVPFLGGCLLLGGQAAVPKNE